MDPITAIANAGGSLFDAIGQGLNIIGLGKQKDIVQEQGKNVDKMSDLERVKYNQLIASGNIQLASQFAQETAAKNDRQQSTIYLVTAATFIAVILIIILKTRKK